MSQNNSFTTSSTNKDAKRLRFTADDDLALLREFVNLNPLEDLEKWTEIQKNILIITGKFFSIRTLKDHLFRILDIWVTKYKTAQIMSGVEEIHSERDQLLQEISDMCNSAKVTPFNKKRKLSKEKQISELGKRSREECARTLIKEKENVIIEIIPEATSIALDHDYPSVSLIEEIEKTNNDKNEYSEAQDKPTTHAVEADTPRNTEKGVLTRKILGPKQNRNNKSAPMRRSALDYLQTKEKREETLKIRQLDLEEEKLNLERRRVYLDEQRQKMEFEERKEKLEMEKARYKQELFERDQTSKIIDQQNELIRFMMEKLKKYEGK